jgi:hypothetical protein
LRFVQAIPFFEMEMALMQMARCNIILDSIFPSVFAAWPTFHPMRFRRVKGSRPFHFDLP